MAENNKTYPSTSNVLAFSSLYTIHEQSTATTIATKITSPTIRIHPWTSTIQNMRAVVKQSSSSSAREFFRGSENTACASLKPNMSSPNSNNNTKTLLPVADIVRKKDSQLSSSSPHRRSTTTTLSHSQHSIPREISTSTTTGNDSHNNRHVKQDNMTKTTTSKDDNVGAYYFTFDTQEIARSKNGKRLLQDHKTTHHHHQQQQHHHHQSKQRTKIKKKKRSSDNDISARLMNGPGRFPASVRAIDKKKRLFETDNYDPTNRNISSPSPSYTALVVFDIADQQQHNEVPHFTVHGEKELHHDARLDHLFFPQAQEANSVTTTTTTTSMEHDVDTGTSENTEMATANKKKKKSVHWNRVNVYVYHNLAEDDDDASEQEEDLAGDSNDEAKTLMPTTVLVKTKPTKRQVIRAKVRALPIKSASFSTSNLSNCFRRRRQKLSFLDRFMKERQVEMKKKRQQEDPRLREANEKWAVSYGHKKGY